MGSQDFARTVCAHTKILEHFAQLFADVLLGKMKTVTLWGYYGYGNVGDEALLTSMLSLLDGVRIKLISGPVPSVKPTEDIDIIPRSTKNLYSSVSKSDAFVLGAGGLLHERIKIKSTWYHLAGPAIANFQKKPVAAIGQQIGPFSRSSTRNLVTKVMKNATLTVRDQKSLVEAQNLGLKPILSGDLAFLIEPNEPSKELIEKIKKLPKPVIIFAPAVYPSTTPPPEWSAKILSFLQEKSGGSILSIPFFPGMDDQYIEQVMKVKPLKGLVLRSPLRWQDAFGCFLMADYSVPMRLHAMIASAMAGLPTLPIPYFPKVPMIASDLGITSMISGNDSLWESKCTKFLESSDLLGVVTKQGAARMKKRAEVSVTVLKEFLDALA